MFIITCKLLFEKIMYMYYLKKNDNLLEKTCGLK